MWMFGLGYSRDAYKNQKIIPTNIYMRTLQTAYCDSYPNMGTNAKVIIKNILLDYLR